MSQLLYGLSEATTEVEVREIPLFSSVLNMETGCISLMVGSNFPDILHHHINAVRLGNGEIELQIVIVYGSRDINNKKQLHAAAQRKVIESSEFRFLYGHYDTPAIREFLKYA